MISVWNAVLQKMVYVNHFSLMESLFTSQMALSAPLDFALKSVL